MKPQNEWNKKEYFNSQPHKEADFLLSKPGRQVTDFNSQPHKEADTAIRPVCSADGISTHSLTRRLTRKPVNRPIPGRYFNSQPHKEAD